MTNLLQCLTCKKIITAEEGENHHCKPIINKHRIVSAPSFFTVIDDNGILNLVIDGFDHIGYIFEIKEPKLIPIILTCNVQQPKSNTEKTTEDETESK